MRDMAVYLVRSRVRDSRNQTGLGGYADMVRDVLSDMGVDTIQVEADLLDGGSMRRILLDNTIVPILQTMKVHRGDVCHYTFEGLGFTVPFCRARKIVTFHHFVTEEEGNNPLWLLAWRVSARLAVRAADRIIAISENTADEIVRGFGVDRGQITVIPYMANDRFSKLPSVQKRRRIGSMGSLVERKNYPAMLRVFKGLSETEGFEDYELHICGKGRMREELDRLAVELGISDRVTFVQDLDTAELNEFYNSCALCLYTTTHEGMGMTTLESQMCGTPVLYFRWASIPMETLEAAVPCDDEADMVSKCVSLLSDPGEYDRVVREGLEFTRKFRNGYRDRTADVYREVIGTRT